jgi:hypothetical protein
LTARANRSGFRARPPDGSFAPTTMNPPVAIRCWAAATVAARWSELIADLAVGAAVPSPAATL